jgi:hypothetical protein
MSHYLVEHSSTTKARNIHMFYVKENAWSSVFPRVLIPSWLNNGFSIKQSLEYPMSVNSSSLTSK